MIRAELSGNSIDDTDKIFITILGNSSWADLTTPIKRASVTARAWNLSIETNSNRFVTADAESTVLNTDCSVQSSERIMTIISRSFSVIDFWLVTPSNRTVAADPMFSNCSLRSSDIDVDITTTRFSCTGETAVVSESTGGLSTNLLVKYKTFFFVTCPALVLISAAVIRTTDPPAIDRTATPSSVKRVASNNVD